ncbi:hypothetical protein [Nocardioides sp. CER19]|uniref:hypothetical protein n=1 Tax=Nocardioides sp. CER19 TaxID=3038538 RepID=UPI0024497D89|nr:hypothetical protein [Nocardioides sp. CER19]MDH2416899.1 hypothetical protein [Nocardioides sp. CER19]
MTPCHFRHRQRHEAAHRADAAGLRSWVAGARYHVVQVIAAHTVGRGYRLDRDGDVSAR